MKPKTKRAGRIKRRFDDAKELSGEILGCQVRKERRIWKKVMSKHSRRLDREAMKESIDLLYLDH